MVPAAIGGAWCPLCPSTVFPACPPALIAPTCRLAPTRLWLVTDLHTPACPPGTVAWQGHRDPQNRPVLLLGCGVPGAMGPALCSAGGGLPTSTPTGWHGARMLPAARHTHQGSSCCSLGSGLSPPPHRSGLARIWAQRPQHRKRSRGRVGVPAAPHGGHQHIGSLVRTCTFTRTQAQLCAGTCLYVQGFCRCAEPALCSHASACKHSHAHVHTHTRVHLILWEVAAQPHTQLHLVPPRLPLADFPGIWEKLTSVGAAGQE